MGKNILCFLFNSYLGSYSDRYGRKALLALGVFLQVLPILVFAGQRLLMTRVEHADPLPDPESDLVRAVLILPTLYERERRSA
jgi:hypothetical protein